MFCSKRSGSERRSCVTKAGGAPEAIDPGVSGWVVDVNSPEALAEAVINIQRNPSLAASAALRGPLFVRQHFGMSRMIAETLDAYGMKQPKLREPGGRHSRQ